MNKLSLVFISVCLSGLIICLPSYGEIPQYGIATQSVINLRQTPSVAAEMGTQALMGTPVKILSTDDGWSRLMTPDGYTAWATEESVQKMDSEQYKAWEIAPKVIVTTYFAMLRESPNKTSEVVSDVVWGDILRNNGETDGFYKVQLPDSRVAYLKKDLAMPFDQWIATRQPTAENIIATAKHFIGFPYLWGGTSIKGMDCSGFTKTCFFLNGVILRRDAYQQAQTGEKVDISKGLDKLKAGDLLFFGSIKGGKEHVSHVGLYIGMDEFIQSAGMVHISSLRPTAKNYDAYNTKRLLCARRILTCINQDSGIVSITKSPFYFYRK
jgi:SH3-like domain-containing protein